MTQADQQDPLQERVFVPDQPLPRGMTLLEASAGTGKTYNITNLVLRLVAEEGLRIDEILVVTFTRAATAELRDRVRCRLGDAVSAAQRWELEAQKQSNDPDLDALLSRAAARGDLARALRRLRSAYESFDECTISTIHGFCQRMLQLNAFESGVDFDARVAGDPGPLLEEVVDDFLSQELHGASEPWVEYCREVSSASRATLLDLAGRLEANPDIVVAPDPAKVKSDHPAQHWIDIVREYQKLWRSPEGRDHLLALLKTRATTKKSATSQANYLGKWLDLEEYPNKDFPHKKQFFSSFAEKGLNARLEAKGEPPLHDVALQRFDEVVQTGLVTQVGLQLRFVLWAPGEIKRRKEARNLQTFADILRLLDDSLKKERGRKPLRAAIARQYRAALIDEFQDTDPVQWSIFRQVFGNDASWLILIGDPKQAIYGFRGADVFAYLDAKALAEQGRYTLDVNWRSDEGLVRAVAHLFGRANAFSPEGSFAQKGIDFVQVRSGVGRNRLRFPTRQLSLFDGEGGDSEEEEVFSPTHTAPLELVFLDRAMAQGGIARTGEITKSWMREHLPRMVASDVVRLLQSGATIRRGEKGESPIEPADIAVLVRSNQQAREIQEHLVSLGVPAVTGSAGSVFDSDEATWIQRLLDAIVSPAYEGVARAALATPLFGYDAAGLAALDEEGGELWAMRLRSWQETMTQQGVFPTLRQAFEEMSIAERVLTRPRGERSMTNVLHLSELLHRAEAQETLKPTALARWLRQQRLGHVDDSDAAEIRLESDEDAAQVITMHRAKGLEYPVVFCPYMWDGKLLSPPSHWQGGVSHELRHLTYHDRERQNALSLDLHLSRTNPPKSRHIEMANQERHAENLRLAYVALTRGRHAAVLYWAKVEEGANSPLSFLLHPAAAASAAEQVARTKKRFADLSDDEMMAELVALAASSQGTIKALRRTTLGEPPTFETTGGAKAKPRAKRFTRPGFSSMWRRGSFTAMTRRRTEQSHDLPQEGSPEAEGAAGTEEGRPSPIDGAPSDDSEPNVPLAEFPGGREAGTFLHKVLEMHDFQNPGALSDLLTTLLPRHGFPVDPWLPSLVQGLNGALNTPLGGPLGDVCLASIGRDSRLDELSFDFPVAGGYEPGGGPLKARHLRRIFETSAPNSGAMDTDSYMAKMRELDFLPLLGFLTGAIDLVFCVGHGSTRRWFLADYKSNWLGDPDPSMARSVAGHYRLPALKKVMEHHHYYLQYHLYSVALHRFLRSRLGKTYDYDRHFGGCYYLFVRGMIGKEAPRDGEGHVRGVFFDRPSQELIEGFSRQLACPMGGTP